MNQRSKNRRTLPLQSSESSERGPKTSTFERVFGLISHGFFMLMALICHCGFVCLLYGYYLSEYNDSYGVIAVVGCLILFLYFMIYYYVGYEQYGRQGCVLIIGSLLHECGHYFIHTSFEACLVYSAWGYSMIFMGMVIDQQDRLHIVKLTGMCFGQAIIGLLMEKLQHPLPDHALYSVALFAIICLGCLYVVLLNKLKGSTIGILWSIILNGDYTVLDFTPNPAP